MLFDFNKKPYRSSVIVGRTNATIAKFNTSAQGYEEPDFVELDKHFDLIYDCLLYTSEKLAYVWGASGVTPMERQAVGFIDINKNYATKLRGYGFGNILTEAHITQLGGIEAIKKEAPCYMAVSYTHLSTTKSRSYSYGYDKAGNRQYQSITEDGDTETDRYSYNNLYQLIKSEKGNGSNTGASVWQVEREYQYDAYGNRTLETQYHVDYAQGGSRCV